MNFPGPINIGTNKLPYDDKNFAIEIKKYLMKYIIAVITSYSNASLQYLMHMQDVKCVKYINGLFTVLFYSLNWCFMHHVRYLRSEIRMGN